LLRGVPSDVVHYEPPHCPCPDCDSHADPETWRAIKKGFYLRSAAPQKIQRYRCSRCRRSFSSQTFSPTYWLRFPQLQSLILFRGLGMPHQPLAIESILLMMSSRSVKGSIIGSPDQMRRMLDFAAKHGVAAWTGSLAMNDVNSAIARVRKGDLRYRMVLASG
jgi:hypothetical protein